MQSKKINYFLAILVLVFFTDSHAKESVDYVAEHLLEIPMDFRYLALAQVPLDQHSKEYRIQLGMGQVEGGLISTQVPMLGFQYFLPLTEKRGLNFSLFYDEYSFSAKKGYAIVSPSFTRQFSPESIDVEILGADGKGFHAGLGFSYIYFQPGGSNHQIGAIIETLDINKFEVQFKTLNLAQNYTGVVDYAATYNAITPYYSYEKNIDDFGNGWIGRLKITIALPLPRVGFEGRIRGPGFDISGDTREGLGTTNIPDMYAGIGYSLEHKASSLRIEVGGGGLYSYLLEPLVHKETNAPVFVSASYGF